MPLVSALDLAILGLLQEQELHGYEIRRRLRDELGLFSSISFGSLYPALSRLERADLLSAAEAGAVEAGPAVPPIPMTGSLSGERAALRSRRSGAVRVSRRSRKVYRITETGRQRFVELLGDDEQAADDPRSFGLRLAFARHLAPQARLGLLERRRAQLAKRLAEDRARAASGEGLDPYARSVVEHTAESTERDISWIDRLIEAERRTESQPQSQHPQPLPDTGGDQAVVATGTTKGTPQ